jgi:hypothetical protein
MLRRFTVDVHNLLSLTSLSLLYCFVNVLYIWTLYLLVNTFWQEWSRIVTLCNELLHIISFELYTLSMTLLDATEHYISVSHVSYIWIVFLLLNIFWHEWWRLVTPCNELIYIINFDTYTFSKTFLCNLTQSQFLAFFTSGLYFYFWTRFDTNSHEL